MIGNFLGMDPSALVGMVETAIIQKGPSEAWMGAMAEAGYSEEDARLLWESVIKDGLGRVTNA